MKLTYLFFILVLAFLCLMAIMSVLVPELRLQEPSASSNEAECIDNCIKQCLGEKECVADCLHAVCKMQTSKGGMGMITTAI
jgi:uncharacterized protein YpmS